MCPDLSLGGKSHRVSSPLQLLETLTWKAIDLWVPSFILPPFYEFPIVGALGEEGNGVRAPIFEVDTRNSVRRKNIWRTQLDDAHHLGRHCDDLGVVSYRLLEGDVRLLPQLHHVNE